MARTHYLSEAEVRDWMGRQNKPLKWSKAVDTGRVEDDAWSSFLSIEELPRGVKLLVRAEGGKGGVHVTLPPSGEGAIITYEAASIQRRMKELDLREQELNRREMEMLSEQRRAQMENATIARKLDERSSSIAGNLKDWELSIRERNKGEVDMLNALDAAISRAQDAEATNEIAASITYASDRVLGALQLWRVKSINDIPPETLADFQGYLQERAHRRYLEHLPDAPRKWATDFMRMPKGMRDETLKAITASLADEAKAKQSAP